MKIFVKPRESLTKSGIRRKKKLISRNRKVHNFTSATSVGIFYDTIDTESFQKIRDFSKQLMNLGLKTEILGYVNTDVIPSEMVLWDKCHVLNNKDIDWLFKPNNEYVNEFIEKEFDILLDLSLVYSVPSNYIVNLSRARFKVGRYQEAGNDLDFMINIEQKKTVGFLIEQINNYVSMLNSSEK